MQRHAFPREKTPESPQWQLELIDTPSQSQLWFSDGLPLTLPRGDRKLSSRLIIENQGFLDITDLTFCSRSESFIIELNDAGLALGPTQTMIGSPYTINLTVKNGVFIATYGSRTTLGRLKPFPSIGLNDITLLHRMIRQKVVPYQHIPHTIGKTHEEIAALGRRFFPWTPHSYELALAVYDWTTASFARMVFMKMFQYTSMPANPDHPVNYSEVAKMIWLSDWDTYNPSDETYMYSFLMKPADSLEDVQRQLKDVAPQLLQLSEAQNRILAAAFASLPRTPYQSTPRLFSGQPDISQLSSDHFAVGFLECPANIGPVSDTMTYPFAAALASYLAAGKTVTTKMVWSFSDSFADAVHYSNGILMVLHPNLDDGSRAWESGAFITPLSDEDDKIEYTFAAGSQFEVLSVERNTIKEKEIVVLNLRPVSPPPSSAPPPSATSSAPESLSSEAAAETNPIMLGSTSKSSLLSSFKGIPWRSQSAGSRSFEKESILITKDLELASPPWRTRTRRFGRLQDALVHCRRWLGNTMLVRLTRAILARVKGRERGRERRIAMV